MAASISSPSGAMTATFFAPTQRRAAIEASIAIT